MAVSSKDVTVYPIANGLPNNRRLKVFGRAYAAPGDAPPVLWRGGWWVAPSAAAGAVVCVMQLLSVLL